MRGPNRRPSAVHVGYLLLEKENQRLRDLVQDLEQKVMELTAELAELNRLAATNDEETE